jgi:hypothetical protein
MYASSSAKLLLHVHTPQRPNARGYALIDVLISLAGGKGPGGIIFSVMEACKARCTDCSSRGCWAASYCQFQLVIYSTCSLIIWLWAWPWRWAWQVVNLAEIISFPLKVNKGYHWETILDILDNIFKKKLLLNSCSSSCHRFRNVVILTACQKFSRTN